LIEDNNSFNKLIMLKEKFDLVHSFTTDYSDLHRKPRLLCFDL